MGFLWCNTASLSKKRCINFAAPGAHLVLLRYMETNTNLPIYKTRKFWVTVLLIQLSVNLIFFQRLFSTAETPIETLNTIITLMGTMPIWAFFSMFISGHYVGLLSSVSFMGLLALLLKKTFHKRSVSLVYPIVITINSLVSSLILYIILDSL